MPDRRTRCSRSRPRRPCRRRLKYFWVVAALIVAQVGLGAVTAHYGVEGSGFYGIPLAMAALSGDAHLAHAARHLLDRHRVAGDRAVHGPGRLGPRAEVPAAGRQLPLRLPAGHRRRLDGGPVVRRCSSGWATMANFWFGHQGYEYVDLGRFWQLFLSVGLFLWLALMARAMWPAFRSRSTNRHLLALFLWPRRPSRCSTAPGLMWHRQTNLAIAEYWRWWVVHLWVEGFFEVFATVVIAFLFTRMGLLKTATATAAVLFSTIIFLAGGHHRHVPPPLLHRHPDGACWRWARPSARWRWCRWC